MIKKIVLKIKNKEISLTLEETKKLHNELCELFGTKREWYYPHRWWYDTSLCATPTTYTTTTDCDTAGSTYTITV